MVKTALFEIICPRCIIRKTYKKDNSGDIILEPSEKTANLRWIKYNIPESVFLRLLLCKEYIKEDNPGACPCSRYKNKFAINRICKSPDKLAHFYFGYEKPEKAYKDTRSCIVLFIKNYIKPEELKQRLMNTIKQLNIGREKFIFHVVPFCYEKISLYPSSRYKIKNEINNLFAGALPKIKTNTQMNEKNELMVLEIGHDKKANEFTINTIVEDRESM